ncbi:hypothetical protein HVZ88_25440 (plasmid) [Escherichia coli]|nr:hypothetical protein HVZ88_25440 [Escherichia coli]
MVKSAVDIKKVLHVQNVMRIAELVRQLKAKNPSATEEEIKAIFENDYQPDIIQEGIDRAKHYISIKKHK